MVDATLASHNAAPATALLHAQKQNQAILGPYLVAPQIGVVKDFTAWVGGSNKLEDARARP